MMSELEQTRTRKSDCPVVSRKELRRYLFTYSWRQQSSISRPEWSRCPNSKPRPWLCSFLEELEQYPGREERRVKDLQHYFSYPLNILAIAKVGLDQRSADACPAQ
jgi:hypothetical protein